ncbi:hypothetical protein C8J56DRAFT_895561 [Mycena floridula]|nr:hypothetical protein C8J56DRAFT_895561 [Mycena floridula]
MLPAIPPAALSLWEPYGLISAEDPFLEAIDELRNADDIREGLVALWTRALQRSDTLIEDGYLQGRADENTIWTGDGHTDFGECVAGRVARTYSTAAVITDPIPTMEENTVALAAKKANTIQTLVSEKAFEEGQNVGFREGRQAGMAEGKLIGMNQGLKSTQGFAEGNKSGRKAGKEAGEEFGKETERKSWIQDGHSPSGPCFARQPKRVFATVAVLTDPPISLSSSTSTSTQTEPTQTKPSSNTSVLPPPKPFSWADEAESIPICTISAIHRPPRDLSILSTGIRRPFASLQRRCRTSRRNREPRIQPLSHTSISTSLPRHPIITRQHPAGISSQKPVFLLQSGVRKVEKSAIQLDWSQDPRLFKLSQALQNLGWSLPK